MGTFRRLLRPAAVLFFSASIACHHAEPLIPVTEAGFRLENRTEDSARPPNPGYSPLQLPLSQNDSDRVVAFLNANADPGAARDYNGMLKMLREQSFKYEDILDKPLFKQWFTRVQTGGVVDARDTKPPAFPPIAAQSGHFWWVFQVHGHDLVGLTIFKEAVPKPQARSAH